MFETDRRGGPLGPPAHRVALVTGASRGLGEVIARVLAELGVRDRVQTAVFSYENGIVRPGPPGGARTADSADGQRKTALLWASRR